MEDFQGKYNGKQIEQLLDKANDIDLSKYALKTDNAPTATKLQAARTIVLSGAVSGSVSSDFGSNVTMLGDKQKQISLATTVEQVKAVDVQSGYPDKVNITMTYVQQQAKEKDASDPQKVAVKFSRMVVNNKAISLSSNEKLDVKVLFPIWGQEGAEFGLSVDTGFCLRVVKEDTDILYEVIQQHTLSKEWEPGLNTASLYKVIDKEHAGTIGDPIPYFPPMEIFKDKYYIQNADVYKCTRDSGTPLSHNLKDLVGLYVEVVQG